MDSINLLKNLLRDLNRLVVTIDSGHPMDMFDDDGKPMGELKVHMDRARTEMKELESVKASLIERESWIYEIAGKHDRYLETLARAAVALHCEACGGHPVLRRRKSDNLPFFGCSGFPDCKQSFRMDDVEEQLKAGFIPWLKLEGTKAETPAPPKADSSNDDLRKQMLDLCRELGVSPESYMDRRKELIKAGFRSEREIMREMVFNLIQEKRKRGLPTTETPGDTG